MQPLWLAVFFGIAFPAVAAAQMTDTTQTPNALGAGIHKSLDQEIGAGRGDAFTPGSSMYIVRRDPFRAIRRGRQVFQRKFTLEQGAGPRTGDGEGDIQTDGSIGAGLVDSCAGCHSRPFGSAGSGGNVFTRPLSRDAPHLFGLGLQEMLADEITRDLRALRDAAIFEANRRSRPYTQWLESKGILYGELTAYPDGSVDTSQVQGVNEDLRVRPFFAQGATISIREFVVGAFNAEMGLESPDTDLASASTGNDLITPAGMLLSGSKDHIEAPPAHGIYDDPDRDRVVDEIPTSLVDFVEFYLLNYFRPGIGPQGNKERNGRKLFEDIGCAQCHLPDLRIDVDRRVADVDTRFDDQSSNGVFNRLFAEATPLHGVRDDGRGLPPMLPPLYQPFLVKDIYADFKRHDLGPNFWEPNFDGSLQKEFMTEALWGVADTAPYGHDGRCTNLSDVILRHGGEAQSARDAFEQLDRRAKGKVLAFLESLVLFSPEDTASNLNPADKGNPDFPIRGHGSISLTPLFLDPTDIE